ncbi:MAG: hypothetical protein Q9216_001592 [Gyalolechia sp. 2 TL-2023]
MAFVLLGFALEKLTGLSYAEIIDVNVFQPVGMEHSKLSKPLDTEGVIPNMTNDWNADIGTYGPTGGIFTTASDLARFARAIFNNKLLDGVTTNAWFKPHSYSGSWSFAYGMPWEIFRTDDLLADSDRIQTVVTKAGGLRGYSSHLVLLPEYEISIVVLVAGDGHALSWLREEILKRLVPVIESIVREQTIKRLAGTYISSAASVNSSVTLEVQGPSGLIVTSWISNGTDFLARYINMSQGVGGLAASGKVQLTPTGTERGKYSEVWRSQFIPDEMALKGIINIQLITDVDTFTYAARSMEEFVFRISDAGFATEVELPAFRTKLVKHKRPIAETLAVGRLHPLMKPIELGD